MAASPLTLTLKRHSRGNNLGFRLCLEPTTCPNTTCWTQNRYGYRKSTSADRVAHNEESGFRGKIILEVLFLLFSGLFAARYACRRSALRCGYQSGKMIRHRGRAQYDLLRHPAAMESPWASRLCLRPWSHKADSCSSQEVQVSRDNISWSGADMKAAPHTEDGRGPRRRASTRLNARAEEIDDVSTEWMC